MPIIVTVMWCRAGAHISLNPDLFICSRAEIPARQGVNVKGVVLLADISAPMPATIPWAEKTGNLTMRTDSVVHSVIYDEQKKRATGVRVIDAHTKAGDQSITPK